MIQIVLTLALSAALGYALYRGHVPAGMLIGAVIASAVLTAVFRAGAMPGPAKHIAQVIAGTYIGCSAKREDLRRLRSFCKPVAVITCSLLLVNVVIGFLLFFAGYSDLLTCLVCAVPGGISDVTLIAVDFGADASKVLVVHFCRLVVGVVLFPIVVQRLTPPVPEAEPAEPQGSGEPADGRRNAARLLAALALASVSAWAGNWLRVPAATIFFSLLSTFCLNFCGFTVRFPGWLRQAAQVLSGAYIGCLLDPSIFDRPSQVFWALGITIAVLLANAAAFGKWMEKRCQIPLREGMLMLTPAGASDMALISADLGFNSPRLVLIQIYRLLIATAVFPQICLLISRIFNSLYPL